MSIVTVCYGEGSVSKAASGGGDSGGGAQGARVSSVGGGSVCVRRGEGGHAFTGHSIGQEHGDMAALRQRASSSYDSIGYPYKSTLACHVGAHADQNPSAALRLCIICYCSPLPQLTALTLLA